MIQSPSSDEATGLELSPSILHHHLADNIEHRLAFRGGDVKAWQRKLRRKIRDLIGWPQMPKARCELNVRTLWKRSHELGTIEKVVFTAEPHSDVTAFVCLPRGVEPPYTFFLCLQGHSTGAHVSIAVDREDNSRPFAVEGDRDYGLGCMRRGLAALCIEQRSFGERRERQQQDVSPHGCHDATMHALMLGRTLLGERVYDVDRGIDYLAWRGDADMKKIGVMGNSGGGTVSLFAAAVLSRLAFAMPSSYFCTFRHSILAMYHCADNYVPGLLQYAEMADVMGLFAPRPVVVVNGREDPIFPFHAAESEFARLQEIYRAAGAADACRFAIGEAGHRFYADAAWEKMLPLLGR